MKKHLQVNILMFQWRDERNVFMRRQSSVFRFGHCHTNFNRSCKNKQIKAFTAAHVLVMTLLVQ